MLRMISSAAELEATALGSIIGTGYGLHVLGATDLANSKSYMEDLGSVSLLAEPSAYDRAPLLKDLSSIDRDLSDFTAFVLYEEETGEPDCVTYLGYLRRNPNSHFAARRISFPE